MALTSVPAPGEHSVLCTGKEISTAPAWEYVDNKRTDTQRVDDQGQKLFSVRGVVPLIEGEIVPDGSVQITREIPQTRVRPGQIFAMADGVFTARAAAKFGLTGTLRGSRLIKSGGDQQ